MSPSSSRTIRSELRGSEAPKTGMPGSGRYASTPGDAIETAVRSKEASNFHASTNTKASTIAPPRLWPETTTFSMLLDLAYSCMK